MTGFIATWYYSWCVKFLMPIKTTAIFRDRARDELPKSSGWLRLAASVISALNVITAKEDARLFLSEIFCQLSNSYHCVSSFRRLNAYAVLITAWKSLSKNITILITTDTTDHSLFLLLTGKTQYLGGGGKGVGGRGGYRRLRYEQCTNTAKREWVLFWYEKLILQNKIFLWSGWIII